MKSRRQRLREYGELTLLMIGFLAGVGLVVTCGGSGGSGPQQGGTSTASTISFTPIDLGTVNFINAGVPDEPVGIPPALSGVSNVQDALNRINAILDPTLSRASDPEAPENRTLTLSQIDAQLPGIVIGADGEPLTFSRRLAGLIRSVNVAGPLRADVNFRLSCAELDAVSDPLDQPFVARLFCARNGTDDDPSDDDGVFEIFQSTTPMQDGAISSGSDSGLVAAISNLRLRLDGRNSTIETFSNGVRTIGLNGTTGSIEALGELEILGNADLGSTLDVAGAATFDASVLIAGLATLQSDVEVLGNTNSNTLSVVGDATVNGDQLVQGSILAGVDVTANDSVTASSGNLLAPSGFVLAGFVPFSMSLGSGDIGAEANVRAVGNILAGNVDPTNPNLSANGDVAAAANVRAGQDVVAENGVVQALNGVVLAGAPGFVPNGGDVAAAGTVHAGNTTTLPVPIGPGDIAAQDDVIAGGDITAVGVLSAANFNSGGTVIAGTDVVATTGDVSAPLGTVSAGNTTILPLNPGDLGAAGDVQAANNVIAVNGTVTAGSVSNLTVAAGDIAAGNNIQASVDVLAPNGTVQAGSTAGLTLVPGDVAAGHDIVAANDVTAPNGSVIAGADPNGGVLGAALATDFVDNRAGLSVVSTTDAGRLVGNRDLISGRQVFEISDQSVDPLGGHRLVQLGEDPTMADNGFVAVFDQAQTSTITLAGTTGTVSASESNGRDRVTAGPLAAPLVTLDGQTGDVSATSVTAATVVSDAVNSSTTIDVGNGAVVIDGTNSTVDVGNGTVVLDGSNSTIDVNGAVLIDGANSTVTTGAITLDGVTNQIDLGGGAIILDGNNSTVTAGGFSVDGANSLIDLNGNVTLDGIAGQVTASALTATGTVTGENSVEAGPLGAPRVTLDGVTGDISAAGTIAAGGLATVEIDVNGDGLVRTDTTAGIGGVVVSIGQHPDSIPAFADRADGRVRIESESTGVPIALDGCSSDVVALTKSFVHPHPTDPSKMIHYRALEGPENTVFARGRGRLIGGTATIQVPESFALVAAAAGLSVTVTPMGDCLGLYVPSDELNRDGFVVRELGGGGSTLDFSWVIYGTRRGMEVHEDIAENRFFVPTHHDVPFMPAMPGLQAILIGNGTLKSDGKPNVGTAERMGWTLKAKTVSER